jgi:putrescine aminotransferase
MRFAFIVHPLSEETKALLQWDQGGNLRRRWGGDLIEFCSYLHHQISQRDAAKKESPRVRLIDELLGLVSATGASAEGRLYEIPMDAEEILADPVRAMEMVAEATQMAADWGAELVGLGSMTGVIGGQGTYLAEHAPISVTTGNSLTVYAALQNLQHVCAEANVDLRQETVAVVGVPGSIAAAAAKLLAGQCGQLLIVARRPTPRAEELAAELGAKLLFDIPEAVAKSLVVLSATSTGNCIDQHLLRPGSVVVDVAVPTDVRGSAALRDDVLFITGGLSRVPESMPLDSMFLGFHHGMIPSCLGETMLLALEQRPESYSLGRNLDIAKITRIGTLATSHGFDFSRLYSFGQQLEPSTLAHYLKAASRRRRKKVKPGKHIKANGRANVHEPNGRENRSENGYANGHANGHGSNGHEADRDEKSQATAGRIRHKDVWIEHDGTSPLCNGHPRAAAGATVVELADRAARLHQRYINPVLIGVGLKNNFTKTFVRGEGNYLWDAAGRRYLDLVAGFGSVNLGHNHPGVAAAIASALSQQAPGFAQAAVNPLAAALAEQLVGIAPPNLEMVFFANSGAETVEAALKLARIVTGRAGLLHCEGSFHGKSLGALSVTGNPNYQKPFGPLLPNCRAVRFGDLEALERALATRQFAAFIVEPIQAEGGMIVPPEGYLREAQELCHATETLLIVDEVQTGLGRTGEMFAVEHDGVEPDVMTLAKSLGGGLMPIGAMLCRRDLWHQAYGTLHTFALHTSTFGGGSLACAAGLATIKALEDEQLAAQAKLRGRQFFEGLSEICDNCDLLREVRGRGLLLGLEFNPLPETIVAHWRQMQSQGMGYFLVPQIDKLVEAVPSMYAMQNLLNEFGIYTQVARSNPLVLRIQPPLTITHDEVATVLAAIAEVCFELDRSNKIFDTIVVKSTLGEHTRSGKLPAASNRDHAQPGSNGSRDASRRSIDSTAAAPKPNGRK